MIDRRVGARAVKRKPGAPMPRIAAEEASFPMTTGSGPGADDSPMVRTSPSPNERTRFTFDSGFSPPSGIGSE